MVGVPGGAAARHLVDSMLGGVEPVVGLVENLGEAGPCHLVDESAVGSQ